MCKLVDNCNQENCRNQIVKRNVCCAFDLEWKHRLDGLRCFRCCEEFVCSVHELVADEEHAENADENAEFCKSV